jgi:hypothetical protein
MLSTESRYLAQVPAVDSAWRLYLPDREPFGYRDRPDNLVHLVSRGDDWSSIAEKYYYEVSTRACGLWWILCDFQPQPVIDPTLELAPGLEVIVPSPLTVQSEILGVRMEEYL